MELLYPLVWLRDTNFESKPPWSFQTQHHLKSGISLNTVVHQHVLHRVDSDVQMRSGKKVWLQYLARSKPDICSLQQCYNGVRNYRTSICCFFTTIWDVWKCISDNLATNDCSWICIMKLMNQNLAFYLSNSNVYIQYVWKCTDAEIPTSHHNKQADTTFMKQSSTLEEAVVRLLMGQNFIAGLFLAALGTQMAASASRWMPEPLSFLMKVFTQIINDTQSSQKPSSAPVFSFRNSQSDQIGKESRRHSLNSSNIPLEEPPKLKFDFQGSQNSREDLSESCSIAAVELLDRIASQNEGLLSLPEALSSALNSLERLQKQATLPKVSRESCRRYHGICSDQNNHRKCCHGCHRNCLLLCKWSENSWHVVLVLKSAILHLEILTKPRKRYIFLTVNMCSVIMTTVRAWAVRCQNGLERYIAIQATPSLSDHTYVHRKLCSSHANYMFSIRRKQSRKNSKNAASTQCWSFRLSS